MLTGCLFCARSGSTGVTCGKCLTDRQPPARVYARAPVRCLQITYVTGARAYPRAAGLHVFPGHHINRRLPVHLLAPAIAALVFLCLACVVSASPADERAPVDYSLAISFGGFTSGNGLLTPVTVTIDNPVATTDAVLRVSQPDRLGRYEVVNESVITIPCPSERRYTVLTRLDTSRNVKVEVISAERLQKIEQVVDPKPTRKATVLCLGVPALYLRGAAGQAHRYVPLEAPDFPHDSRGYDSVHAVILNVASVSSLTRKQASALRTWALSGGRLLLVGEAGRAWTEPKCSLLLGDTQRSAARTGVEQFGLGLLGIQHSDDLLTPFWLDDAAARDALFPPRTTRQVFSASDEYHAGSGVFAGMASRLEGGLFGPVTIVLPALLLCLYLAAIGPLDRRLVRRLKRPLLTWAFFSVAIAVFSLAATGYGRLGHRRAMRLVQLSIVDAPYDGPVARGNSICWVYAPRHADFRLDCLLDGVTLSARESLLSAGEASAVKVVHGKRESVAARIPVFSSKMFDAAWYTPWTNRLQCVSAEGGLEIVVPDELKVRSAYLADQEGVTACALSPENGTWAARGRTESWRRFFVSEPQGVDTVFGPRWDRRPAAVSLKAWRPQFERYLIWVSFVSMPADERGTEVSGEAQTRVSEASPPASAAWAYYANAPAEFHSRDGREVSLNVRDRLRNGSSMLLLFLDSGKEGLLPLRSTTHSPETLTVDLVRVLLPASVLPPREGESAASDKPAHVRAAP